MDHRPDSEKNMFEYLRKAFRFIPVQDDLSVFYMFDSESVYDGFSSFSGADYAE